MNIIQRNFLRLLRAGAFGTRETVEPMSEWKWQQLYQLARQHGVTPWVADGISRQEGDFFLQLSPTLRQQFASDTTERIEEYGHLALSNPVLNDKLQEIAEKAGQDNLTYELLQNIVAIARTMLTSGVSLRELITLGTYLRNTHDPIDYDSLQHWLHSLGLRRMARLEGGLLVELFGFDPDEIHFADVRVGKSVQRLVSDLFLRKRRMRYIGFFPREAVVNYATNLYHHLRNIEE